jgi:hypothetical protein
MGITLEQAKSMMTNESYDKLKKVVTNHPNINMENKVNCDILMQALCRAVAEEVILPESLDDRLVKLLNAKTNTLSPIKLGDILTHIRKKQPQLACVLTLLQANDDTVIDRWIYVGPNINFTNMMGDIIKKFEITTTMVRTKMTETLKPTIVNNIAQCVARYMNNEDKDLNVSITTISRLVNMCGYLLYADFKEV